MMKKSSSTPTLSKMANQRMVKSGSSTSISDMLSVSNDGPKWTMNDVQHVAIFIPINNVAKCMVSHTFPGSILSDGDNTNLDMGLCMVDPGYAENICKDECDFENCIKSVRRTRNNDENENIEDGIENQKLFFENQK